jgi:hypothetical protein
MSEIPLLDDPVMVDLRRNVLKPLPISDPVDGCCTDA